MKRFLILSLFAMMSVISFSACADDGTLKMGAECTKEYLPKLKGQRVALLANHTATVGEQHLVDMLVEKKINVVGIFSPEHGFRGNADAGEHVKSSVDEKTGIPIWSLYDGKSGRPSEEKMKSFDVLVVDMQDVGLRFYTYYISMIKMINACADYGCKVIVLDRPNPNGMYVDGPILDMAKYKSGVGALPIPVVHGLTMGEIALMAQGEGWSTKCDVEVITCKNYSTKPVTSFLSLHHPIFPPSTLSTSILQLACSRVRFVRLVVELTSRLRVMVTPITRVASLHSHLVRCRVQRILPYLTNSAGAWICAIFQTMRLSRRALI